MDKNLFDQLKVTEQKYLNSKVKQRLFVNFIRLSLWVFLISVCYFYYEISEIVSFANFLGNILK